MYERGTVKTASGNTLPLKDHVPREEAVLLYRAVRKIKPAHTVEVGLGLGVSSVAILQALENNSRGHHHILDPYAKEAYDDAGLVTIAESGLGHRMTFHRNRIEDVYGSIPECQFAFIDDGHIFDTTLAIFTLIDRRLKVGGVVGFHDLWLPSQQKVIRYILSNRHYVLWHPKWGEYQKPAPPRWKPLARFLRPEVTQEWKRIGIPNLPLLMKKADDDRKWDFHRDF